MNHTSSAAATIATKHSDPCYSVLFIGAGTHRDLERLISSPGATVCIPSRTIVSKLSIKQTSRKNKAKPALKNRRLQVALALVRAGLCFTTTGFTDAKAKSVSMRVC